VLVTCFAPRRRMEERRDRLDLRTGSNMIPAQERQLHQQKEKSRRDKYSYFKVAKTFPDRKPERERWSIGNKI
jgi:hypothetical protein